MATSSSSVVVGGGEGNNGASENSNSSNSSVSTCSVAAAAPHPEFCRAHHYAQELNNSAAACIEIGLYGRAAISLKRALKLSKRTDRRNPKNALVCNCYHCTLDGCIVRSTSNNRSGSNNNNNYSNDNDNNASPVSVGRASASSNEEHGESADNNSYSSRVDRSITIATNSERPTSTLMHRLGYVHKEAIRVKSQGHIMGPALCLIITYNLALTHHLIALHLGTSPTEQRKNALKARDLYKLTFQTQGHLINQMNPHDPAGSAILDTVQSIRFELILLNNISMVYALTQQQDEKEACLHKLLSTVMVVVDHNVRAIDTPENQQGENTENNQNNNGSNDNNNSRRRSNNNIDVSRSSHSSSSSSHGTTESCWRIQLDGFLVNTIHLVLKPVFTALAA